MVISSWLVVIVALIAAGVNLLYAIRGKIIYKRITRALNSLASIYLASVYYLVAHEVLEVSEHSVHFIRPGILFLLLLLIAEPVTDWKHRFYEP